jgi:ABC-type cobalamin/Fe3+-siderophores transport system ATPase subunit
MSDATSPAASGPAGPHFEGQVGAAYLLSMLVGAEPRGLPGTVIERVAFQKAAEGHPLDDVIVHARDHQGKPATLEIQVKRTVTFAPSDEVFKAVVGQIAEAAKKPEFASSRYELAIAIARSSFKIDGPYQDVLSWARQLGDARTFIDRINRHGSANDDMRSFVDTFRKHLEIAGAAHDDESVWRILGRLCILPFDFASPGSAAEQLAEERAVRALHHEDGGQAAALWKVLTEFALDIAKSGGDKSKNELIEYLVKLNFRLAGDRQTLKPRQALAEASRYVLADIRDRVDDVKLTRQSRIDAVRLALDKGRYVEIRGNAGVGKSALLKHLAEQLSTETTIIALNPARTPAKGWPALRAMLGFDGSARDLLSDLAAGGSAILFIDGLDFFGAQERLTVIDLVREAAGIPGLLVIATTRRDFGVIEENWLPAAALEKLGRAEPVIVDELTKDEINELGHSSPQLMALLSDSHPARDVALNLFRLSRLARRPAHAPTLRTEAEMAREWWQSADGTMDQPSHRDRARVLKALAEQALTGAERLMVKDLPSGAVQALVDSESLQDLGDDRVSFRHDVLREWAIANLLLSDETLVEKLPLDRPPSADIARGFEIFARLLIEGTQQADRLRDLYMSVSKPGNNETWGRLALLSLVRSEIAPDVLDKASDFLFADRGKLLRDLIRVVMAVESQSGVSHFAALGMDARKIPTGFNVPAGTSWPRLMIWLLRHGTQLPGAAIRDVVALCQNWALAYGGKDPLSPSIARWFNYWRTQVEKPVDTDRAVAQLPFDGTLTSSELSELSGELKTAFLLFCYHTPEQAAEYLKSFDNHPYRDRALRDLMKFRGTLAQAAPKELAELTASYLIGQDDDEEDTGPLRRAFGHRDMDFVPASPSQGPFYDLLVHAPEHGLPLIRRLVDFAVNFESKGVDFGASRITISLPSVGDQVFAWPGQTYLWSRNNGGSSAVSSALMALEAWAHDRIEKGAPVENVIKDVIGNTPASAAYLMIVVDILLSHWPKTRTAAIPFLACPELLCIDRERVIADNMPIPDIFGLGEVVKEPAGVVSIEILKAKRSRRMPLDCLLDAYARGGDASDREAIVELLRKAEPRLGPPKAKSTLGDPEFMVLHALNRLDPANQQQITVQTANGPRVVWDYVPPQAESDHFTALQAKAEERTTDAGMIAAIRNALDNPAKSSENFAADALAWARKPAGKRGRNETERWMREEAVVSACFIAARDGQNDLVDKHGAWIRQIFASVFAKEHDGVHRTRAGLQYNSPAIAFAGMALLMKHRFDMADLRTLLEVAADNAGVAQGFPAVAQTLAQIDERIPKAILRCALAACTQPWRRWSRDNGPFETQREIYRANVKAAVDAEIGWFEKRWDEPEWPAFEPLHARSRRKPSLRERRHHGRDEEEVVEWFTDHQSGALWLHRSDTLFDVGKRAWLRDVANAYMTWTLVANGSELSENDDPDNVPHEWNEAYFSLLACCFPGLSIDQIDEVALPPIRSLPGQAFLDVSTIFLRAVDRVYFGQNPFGADEAVHVRGSIMQQLMQSNEWKWQQHDLTGSVGLHVGATMAAILFNDMTYLTSPTCYLLEKGIDGLSPFLPLIQTLVESIASAFVATILLNLLEVSPRAEHLGVIRAAIRTWSAVHAEKQEFWVGHAIGRRVCNLVAAIAEKAPALFAPGDGLRRELDQLTGKLVRLGVAEAYQLEETLRKIR